MTSPALVLTVTTAAATTGTTGTTTPATAAAVASSLLTQLVPKGRPARIAALLKARRYRLSFRALRPGTVVVSWFSAGRKPTLIASGRKTFPAADTAAVILRLTTKGTHLLRSATRLKVMARSTFTPRGAAAVTRSRSFTLTR